MSIRRGTIKAVLLLLCMSAYANGSVPSSADWHSSSAAPRLSFGQTIALSDFDSDGLIDQAKVANWGVYRSVKVVLSRSGKPLDLHFDNGEANPGSLFAQDVDNDGAADLIWTDLLHSDCVVVWLGNGNGGFSRVPSAFYADGYTLPNQSVNAPDETIRETSIGTADNRNPADARNNNGQYYFECSLPQHELQYVPISSPAFGEPTDRGPPTSLL